MTDNTTGSKCVSIPKLDRKQKDLLKYSWSDEKTEYESLGIQLYTAMFGVVPELKKHFLFHSVPVSIWPKNGKVRCQARAICAVLGKALQFLCVLFSSQTFIYFCY